MSGRRSFKTRNGQAVRVWCAAAILSMTAACIPAAAPAAPAYPSSTVVTGIRFDPKTLVTLAPGSDNWAITWADDGHQYTSWGDGGGFGGTDQDGRVSLGFGRVEGPATAYEAFNVWGGKNSENPAQFTGKSYGILSVGGVLYMWRTGDGSDTGAFGTQRLYRSTDHSASWEFTGVDFGRGDFTNSRGFYCATFLQFGRDYQGPEDTYVYVYAPENKDGQWEVQKPGEIALLRVPIASIADKGAYQAFGGLDADGDPRWVDRVNRREPVFEDPTNGTMRTSVNYNAGLDRYFLITQHVSRFQKNDGFIGIYDAPEPWGPWTTVLFANPWKLGIQQGPKTVFWNFSNKWSSEDGLGFTLVYTGNDNWQSIRGRFETGPQTPAPSRLQAKVRSPTKVRLRWKFDRTSPDAHTIEAQARLANGAFAPVAMVSSSMRRLVLRKLTPEATYTFRVRAHGPNGPSRFSNRRTLTTPARR